MWVLTLLAALILFVCVSSFAALLMMIHRMDKRLGRDREKPPAP